LTSSPGVVLSSPICTNTLPSPLCSNSTYTKRPLCVSRLGPSLLHTTTPTTATTIYPPHRRPSQPEPSLFSYIIPCALGVHCIWWPLVCKPQEHFAAGRSAPQG